MVIRGLFPETCQTAGLSLPRQAIPAREKGESGGAQDERNLIEPVDTLRMVYQKRRGWPRGSCQIIRSFAFLSIRSFCFIYRL